MTARVKGNQDLNKLEKKPNDVRVQQSASRLYENAQMIEQKKLKRKQELADEEKRKIEQAKE